MNVCVCFVNKSFTKKKTGSTCKSTEIHNVMFLCNKLVFSYMHGIFRVCIHVIFAKKGRHLEANMKGTKSFT